MGRTELCQWLRAKSSGIYRPAAEAADEIEMLVAAKDQYLARAMENSAKVNELRNALAAILALPIAKEQLAYLRRGVGTATPNVAWLNAARLLDDERPQVRRI